MTAAHPANNRHELANTARAARPSADRFNLMAYPPDNTLTVSGGL
jgi:hypothetical protein